ncbi:MAG: cysteine desulfurase family protein [Candidatus Dormibacteria bacterium]
MPSVYLDHAATTPLAPGALAAMLPWMEGAVGNPSAVHSLGRRARAAIDDARDRLAGAVGCASREIVVTSGGTEADNLAVRGVLERWGPERGRHLVVSAVEHEAVLNTAERLADIGAASLTVVGCDRLGRVDPAEVAAAVRPDTVLVSVMLANNEVGTLQDVAAMVSAVRSRSPTALVHSDAVQGLGRIPLRFDELGVDLLSLSAHKAQGPVGTGLLAVGQGVFLGGQLTGGGQERGRRSGTENVAGIVGFAAAAEGAVRSIAAATGVMAGYFGRMTKALQTAIPDLILTGDPARRLPGHFSAVIPGCRGEILLARLDEAGVCASAGSACASGAPLPSHVLTAMGYSVDDAACALRLSAGRETTEEDCRIAAELIEQAVRSVRQVGQTRAAQLRNSPALGGRPVLHMPTS